MEDPFDELDSLLDMEEELEAGHKRPSEPRRRCRPRRRSSWLHKPAAHPTLPADAPPCIWLTCCFPEPRR